VPIHEVGQHEGLHYFSMDYIEGRSLASLLRENVLPPKQAANIVRQIAEAIHYAHQQGTLHRDLKPSNVLMSRLGLRPDPNGATGRDGVPTYEPRITDFGLAMRVEGDSGLTQTGQIVGTPSYMPPEQAQGKRSLIGPGSDVYSLGAILYECLTGRAPFRADSVMKTIEQVIHREAASPRLLNSGVPRDLETICLKCLEKEPHRRYGTAQLLADDLQRYLEDRPILARPVSTTERTWRWCRRNPAVASLLVTVALCMTVGIIGTSWALVREAKLRKIAETNEGKANDAAKKERIAKEEERIAKEKAVAAAIEEMKQRDRADQNATLAEKRRKESDQNAKLALRRLYIADMNLAQNAWDANLVDQTIRILDLYRPMPARDIGADDLRGFEWHYLDRLCHSDLRTLRGHTDGVTSVAFSGDGKRLASASHDKTVKVWDTVTGKMSRC
jgi:hypothetical protein